MLDVSAIQSGFFMEHVLSIDVHGAYDKLKHQGARLIDIRDPEAFQAGHIPNSFHLTQGNLTRLLQEIEYDTPLIVMCYHGVSSRNVAAYLAQQGFEEIYNLEGGFAAWKKAFPTNTT